MGSSAFLSLMIKIDLMKKTCLVLFILGISQQSVWAASAEQYVQTVEKINENYQQDTRNFFNTLDPMQRGFTAEQQAVFCKILSKYADDLYQAADSNRAYLDKQYANISKKDVIVQVLSSKEMQMLKRYNVQCNLN